MADTAQDRTEAPTPRRRQEARQRGQVARSADLPPAVILLATLLMLDATGTKILGRLLEVTRHCLGAEGLSSVDAAGISRMLVTVLREFAGMVLPIMLVVFVAALVVSYMQVGLLFTFTPLKPSFDKLNPINGLTRMFSARAWVQLAQGIAKMGLLAGVAWYTVSDRLDALAHASGMNHMAVVSLAAEMLYTLGLRLAIVLLVLAIIDFLYQKYKHERDLRMTKEEVKEELKRMEGDPMIKRRRREIQMQIALQRIRAAVPKADVIVTNPTELAIAIQYDAETMAAPRVVAKGADFLAARIREIAIEHGIPIVERKPLARALYAQVEVGQEIPSQFYKAVAEILAYVYELAGKGYGRRMAVGVN